MIVLLDRLIGVRGQGEKIALEMGFEDSQEVTEVNSRVSVTEADIQGRKTRRKKVQNLKSSSPSIHHHKSIQNK